MYGGWSQVAFLRDLEDEVTPLEFATERLMATRSEGGVKVFDATCPHRGAHLGHGGRLDGDSVVCPFHGHRVHLGSPGRQRFCVREHRAARGAGGVFVLRGEEHENGLTDYLARLDTTHHVVPALDLDIAVPPEYVIENVFDSEHFKVVHGLERHPRLEVGPDTAGGLRVESTFETVRPNQWQQEIPGGGAVHTRFVARVFSPTLVVSELGTGTSTDVVMTAATPTASGGARVRVTVALPRHRPEGAPTVREVASLVDGSRTAFAQDRAVWEHLDPGVVPDWTPADAPVRTFREFCARFAGVAT